MGQLQVGLVGVCIHSFHFYGLFTSDLQGKLENLLSEALRENISLPFDELELLILDVDVNFLVTADLFALVDQTVYRIQEGHDAH